MAEFLWPPQGGSAAGAVTGPASSTDNAVARFNGVTGEVIQNSGVIIDDSNNLSGASSVTISGLTASRAVVTDGSKTLASSSTTSTELGYVAGVTSAIQTQLDGKQTLDSDLTALAGLSTTGLIARTGSGTASTRTLTGPAAGISVSNGDGVSGNPTLALSNDLAALEELASTGIAVRTATDTWAQRTVTASTGISVTNGNGVSGNPTVAIDSTVTTLTGAQALTNKTVVVASNTITTAASGNLSATELNAALAELQTDIDTRAPSSTAVTLSGTQALTNKDYDGGTASNTSRITVPKNTYANLLTLTRKEGTLVYATDLDTFFADDGATLTAVGSGSSTGSGQLNIVDNPSATSSASTGVTLATNYSAARGTSTSPLAGVIDTCFEISTTTASSESATSGFYMAGLACPSAIRSTKLQLSMYVIVPASSLGVWRLSIYNSGGTRVSLSSDSSSVTTLPSGFTGQFNCTFDGDTGATYTVSLTQTTRTSANTLYVTNIVIGNGIITQGAAVSDWQSYTPTGSWVSNTTYTGKYRRVGSTMEVQVTLALTGAPTATDLTVAIPTGFTIDTSALPTLGSYTTSLGTARIYDSGTAGYLGGVLYTTTTSVYISQPTSASNLGLVNATIPFTFGNGDYISANFKVPIAEWAGNGTVNLGAGAQVEYASNSSSWDATDSTNFQYGPAGATISGSLTAGRTKRVRFQYPIQDTDELILELKLANGKWVPISQTLGNYLTTAAVEFGARCIGVSGSSTDVDVLFNQYIAIGSSLTATTGALNWSTSYCTAWRLKKCAPSSPVGFGLVTADSSGLQRGYTSMTKVRLNTGNGFGSTNTTIRRFTTATVNTGTGVTYADSSTLGATFTCAEAGIYALSYSDAFSAAAAFGISLNSSQLTTSIASITAADRLCISVTGGADLSSTVSVTLSLAVGDIIRAHASGSESAVPSRTQFTVQRIA